MNQNTGIEFEKTVTKLFEKYGYTTEHNVNMIGISNVKHQIDVHIQDKQNNIIIECKDHKNNISKKDIIDFNGKLIDIKEANKGLFITTSDFASGAYSMAKEYGIILWNGVELRKRLEEQNIILREKNITRINPHDNTNYIIHEQQKPTYIIKKIKPSKINPLNWFLRITHETINIIYRPYHIINVTCNGYTKNITIDAVRGQITSFNNGITYPLYNLPVLSREDIILLNTIYKYNIFQQRNVKIDGISKSIIQHTLDNLSTMNMITRIKKRPITYKTKIPNNVKSCLNIMKFQEIPFTINNIDDINNINKYDIKYNIDSAEGIIVKYLRKIKIINSKTVYYPFYIVKFYRKDNIVKQYMVDGMTCKKYNFE